MSWTPSPITAALTESPLPVVGTPPSTRIAVNGPPGPSDFIPEVASVAVAVRVTGRLVQPLGRPASLVIGMVVSTWTTVVSTNCADFIPDPDTATAWT